MAWFIPALVAGLSAGGSIAGGVLASRGAGQQADAATQAALLNKQAADDALDFQRDIYADQRELSAPWLEAGGGAMKTLASLMGVEPWAIPQSSVSQLQSPEQLLSSLSPEQRSEIDRLNQEIQVRQSILSGQGGGTWRYGESPSSQGTINKLYAEIDNLTTMRDQQLQSFTSGTSGTGERASGYGQSSQAPTSLSVSAGPSSAGEILPPYRVSEGPTGTQGSDFGRLSQTFGQSGSFMDDPGVQFRLDQGRKIIERSASARGTLQDPGTAKSLMRFGQDLASQEYARAYDRYNMDQTNLYNRLASMAGLGQVSAGQLSSAGQTTALNAGNLITSGAYRQGDALTQAANARASGYAGIGNAIVGGVNNATQLTLGSLMRRGGSGNSALPAGYFPQASELEYWW